MPIADLQQLLQRFLARDIELAELQLGFRSLLQREAEVAAVAAAWLEAGEKDGLLSQAVCAALKDVLVSHMAASNSGPHPGDSGIFEAIGSQGLEAGPTRLAQVAPVESEDDEKAAEEDTAVRDDIPEEAVETRIADRSVDGELRVGSLIGGRYELVEELGEGGMGRVFKARDRLREEAKDRNPFVAIKVLSEQFKAHPDSMIALQREARRAQTLAHPNVITVHEFFRDGPHFYLTMEVLEGSALDKLMRTRFANGAAMDEVWPIIQGVGRALHYGHQKGIIHSDVKPANIFVCNDGTIKVLDLGISRPVPVENLPDSQQTVFDPGKRLGGLTPSYASLEMWSQGNPDPRDDVYALACVSYLLLTGKHPFDDRSSKQAFEMDLSPKRIDSISYGQWRAIEKGLAFRRKDRLPSVARLLNGVDPRSVVRSRWRTAGLVAALVAVVLVAVGVRYYGLAVEDSALQDRTRMQGETPVPVERRDLSPEERAEIDDLMALASLNFRQVGDDAPADDLIYALSNGVNDVTQLVNTVLSIDPGNEAALEMREQVFDLYIERARDYRDAAEYSDAMALARAADSVIGGTSDVLRLQRSICDRSPSTCGSP